MSSRFPPLAIAVLVGTLTVAACHRAPTPDAYGTFETEDVEVSAQTSGQLDHFDVTEGQRLDRGARVAVIDTVQLALQRDQALAERRALTARRTESTDQIETLAVQQQIAERTWQRTQRLLAAKAATAAEADQAEREVRVLATRIRAARAATRAVDAELAAVAARIAQADDRLADAVVTNDTGPRHVAVALDRPVVVLMGPTHPTHTALHLERQRVLRHDVACSPCQLKTCPIDHRCLTGLHPERVLAATRELLAAG